MRQSQIKALGIFGIAVFLALLPATAWAGDTNKKIYPGTMCVPIDYGVTGPWIFSEKPGRVCNIHASAKLWVRCPIVRDNTSGKIIAWRFYGFNPNTTTPIDCRLRSLDPAAYGWDVIYAQKTMLMPYTNGVWANRHLYKGGGIIPVPSYGAYEMACGLPAGACLGSYYVRENAE